jgi:hypothetical protein
MQDMCAMSSAAVAGVKWLLRRLRASAGSVWLALRQMLGPRLWMTTLTLVFTWMVAAFVYYGGSCSAAKACPATVL